ncbi:O-phthalyl amidase [Saccharicrinis fermentans DSM 9555 = JCM 21142]|uniref:O-phthalyl amidase n=2 Tax=Saccharicrinis fermentans TaxID=982 RepID=W7YST5_9BACT|nr:O-phthalyl amidase [Saccharicrinis fermentans DSM 9555 = JCM 21142]
MLTATGLSQEQEQNWFMPDLSGEFKECAEGTFMEIVDSIPLRGTQYRIRVPENWNGTLLSDLDYYKSANSPRNLKLLKMGYALSGTKRRPGRMMAYDPAHEIHDIISVLDIFEAHFGEPAQTIQLGCSGGGTITIAMAEIHPDRIDGAIALCGATSPWMANTHLDALFVLKALLAPELPIVDIPLRGAETDKIAAAWKKAIDEAQQTPGGRARIALAITIGQWPAWGGPGKAPSEAPDLNNTKELQESMYQSLIRLLPRKGTFGTTMIELAAPGQIKGNTGVDYDAFYKNGNELYKKAVETLYEEAQLSSANDLNKVNDFPRLKADASAKQWWSKPGRTHVGEPKVPFLRMSTTGDGLVYPAMVKGYEDLVKEKGYSALLRTAYVKRWGHCTFSVGEWLAAIETMMQRLETGEWPSTTPEDMNKLAKKLDKNSKAAYFNYKTVQKYNRTWVPTINDFVAQ